MNEFEIDIMLVVHFVIQTTIHVLLQMPIIVEEHMVQILFVPQKKMNIIVKLFDGNGIIVTILHYLVLLLRTHQSVIRLVVNGTIIENVI